MTMKTEQKVIGVYTFCSTGSVLVHELDGDKVLASINGKHLEWCDITERYSEDKNDWESGFKLGSFFVPLDEVMIVEGMDG